MNRKEIEDMLLRIYFVDKTPLYGYEGKTIEGHKSFRGSRWLTPREIIKDYFGKNFWKKYKEHYKKGEEEREKNVDIIN